MSKLWTLLARRCVDCALISLGILIRAPASEVALWFSVDVVFVGLAVLICELNST